MPEAELRDGTVVEIRPIEPRDRDALTSGFERMGPESRYARFFTPTSRLSDSQLDYLTRVDHSDHEALVAFESGGGNGLGVARYVKLTPEVAEPAIAVVDDWQGRGLGQALIARLADRAREEGVRWFAAPVLAENERAVALFRGLGETHVSPAGRELELLIALDDGAPSEPGREPVASPGGRSGSRGRIRTFWDRLTTRRRVVTTPRNVVVAGVSVPSPDERTLGVAARLAETLKARLEVVVAVPAGHDPSGGESLGDGLAQARSAGVTVRVRHLHRDLSAAVITVAGETEARAIVLDATPGVGAWRHLVHHAPCDVLLARDRAPGA